MASRALVSGLSLITLVFAQSCEQAALVAPLGAMAIDPRCGSVVIGGDEAFRGTYPEGDEVVRLVSIHNETRATITTRVLSSTCGCLKSAIDESLLVSGATATLRLSTFAAAGTQTIQSAWVAVGFFGDGETIPFEVQKVALQYQAARDWRIAPSEFTGVARVGEPFQFEAYVSSASQTLIDDVRVEALDGSAIECSAVRVQPFLWRITVRGISLALGDIISSVGVELKFPHSAKVRMPIKVRVVNREAFNPTGILLTRSGARQTVHIAIGSPSARLLRAVLDPPCSDVEVSVVDSNTVVVELDAGLSLQYGGRVEVRDQTGNLIGEFPVSITE